MREILFRGKRTDSKGWAYGFVHRFGNSYRDGEHNQWAIQQFDEDGIPSPIEVIKESIGQFVGLLDKNGTNIWEGDIYHMGDKNITYTVVWRDSGLIGKQNGSSSYAGLEHWAERIEVIGNIHESK